MYNLIRRITNCLPLLSIILIGLGILYLFVYYNTIGLIILPYLQPTEILLSSIHIIPLVTISSAAMFIIYEFQYETEDFLDRITDKIKWPIFKLIFWLVSWIPIGIMCFVPLIFISIKNKYLLFQISSIILILTIIYLRRKNRLQTILENGTRVIVMLILISAIVTGVFAFNSSTERLKGKCNSFKLVTRDTTYTNIDSLIYYGRTNGYTILYNKMDSNSVIIPNNLILYESTKLECPKQK